MLSAASNFLEQTSFIKFVSIILILNVIPLCGNAGSTITEQSSLSGSLAQFLHDTADSSGLRRMSPVFGRSLNTLRTGDADLRLYITTVQDG